jgi:uncharacterized protein YabE (DUF348 family)
VNESADNVGGPTGPDTDSTTAVSPDPVSSSAVAAAPRRGLRRKVMLVAAAGTIGLLAIGGGTAAAMAKHVTITVDGEQRQVTTLAGSVQGALSSAGLQTGAHDVLAPAADTQIADGAQIALERARLLTLTINGQQRDVWTTADTVDEALQQLGEDPNTLQLSADRSREIPLTGLTVTANDLHTVSLSDNGAAAVAVQTGALTVADLLAAQNITLAATDTVTPDVGTAVTDGLQVTVTRIAVTTTTESVDVPPTDQQIPASRTSSLRSPPPTASKPGVKRCPGRPSPRRRRTRCMSVPSPPWTCRAAGSSSTTPSSASTGTAWRTASRRTTPRP